MGESELKNCRTKEELVELDRENKLTDEELEKITGGEYGPNPNEVKPGTYGPKVIPPVPNPDIGSMTQK